jgi:hypothetical protein
MPYTIAVFVVLVFAPMAVSGQATTASAKSGTDVEMLLLLIDQISRGFVSRDPSPFEKLYLHTYVSVRGKPIYNARDHLVAMVRSDAAAKRVKKPLDFETVSFISDAPAVRIYGNTAVVTSLKLNEWKYRGSKCLTRYQSTDVWLKLQGEWKLAAGAANSRQCDPAPWYPPHPAVAAIGEITTPPETISDAAENSIRQMLDELTKKTETGDKPSAHEQFFVPDYTSTNVEGELSSNPADLIEVLKAGVHPSQRTTIEHEGFLIFEDSALYIFDARTRPKLGTTERPKTNHYLTVLVRIDGNWKFAASHATNAIN